MVSRGHSQSLVRVTGRRYVGAEPQIFLVLVCEPADKIVKVSNETCLCDSLISSLSHRPGGAQR